jgi:apolipoprotein N-acyltransferase
VAENILVGQRVRASARLVGAQTKIRSSLSVVLLTAISLGACCLVFPPTGWWPLAYVCLVPWLVCVCAAGRSWLVYLMSWLMGLGFFLIQIRWMIPVTTPGYLALCGGFSVFFPLAAWPIRHMYQRYGASVALTAPVAWVAMEYLRSIGDVGFPFLLLGHSQYKILTMIQISDLVGAYGVSFVLAMVNGWIVDLLIQPILIWRSERVTRLPVGSLTTLFVVVGTVIYGSAQRSSRYFKPGPTVAIIQHDFPMFVDFERAGRTSPVSIFKAYLTLAQQAAAENPDLIVLPETAMSSYINDEFLDATPADLEEIRQRRFPHSGKRYVKQCQDFSRRIRDAFQELSTTSGIPIVLGSSSLEWRPRAIPPGVNAYNSAFLLEPGRTTPAARYDKIHLVLFGEYVPFRTSHRWLYEWLNAQTPWGKAGLEYSLSPGSEYDVFTFNAASLDGRACRAAVPICYEEIMPSIARRFTRGGGDGLDQKNIDMLLTISNDGWFLHSAELEQHLATGVFRAIENRIAVARSVNTGASVQIHPNGKIHDSVRLTARRAELLEAVAVILQTCERLAGGLAVAAAEDTAYQAAFDELRRVYIEDLRGAVQAVGEEFAYIDERLGRLLYNLTATLPQVRRDAVGRFRERLADDLRTIARWKDKPWTAPGYIVAEMQYDDRISLYTRWGDWFSRGTLIIFGLMLADWMWRRFARRRRAAGRAVGATRDGDSPEDGEQS